MNMAWAPARVHRVQLADRDGLARVSAWLDDRQDASLFHDPRWLRGVAGGFGHVCGYLVAEGAGGRIAGLLPYTAIRSRLFGSALVSSAFGVGGGILADDPAVTCELADAALRLAGGERMRSVELRGGAMPEGWEADRDTYAGFSRPLAADRDAELLAVPRKQRAEIRRALGLGLEVSTGRDAAMRAEHHRVYAVSVRNLGTPVFARRLFSAMLDSFGDDAEILTVRRNGEALASVLSFTHRGAFMPYWGGGTVEARTSRANDLMYFSAMERARERGCIAFDFGRSKTGTGAYQFKKNWGFAPQPLVYWGKVLSGEARTTNPNDARYARKVALWKRLPLPLANFLGPMISRGLG